MWKGLGGTAGLKAVSEVGFVVSKPWTILGSRTLLVLMVQISSSQLVAADTPVANPTASL